ncbi:MAG: hypothetical protein K2J20_04480 [Bacilli bacterium]|nr:hypothetical protein [Bacilli bacterium]
MKKKRILIGVIVVLVVLISGILVLWKTGKIFSSENLNKENINNNLAVIEKDNYKYLEKDSNGNYIDNSTKNIVYDKSAEYPDANIYMSKIYPMDDINGDYVLRYVQFLLWIVGDNTIQKFDDNTVAAMVSLASFLYGPRTEVSVKYIAKQLFNLDDYELPTGTYKIKNYGEYTIMKENGYYFRSEVNNKVNILKSEFVSDLKINDNKIVLSLDENDDSYFLADSGCYLNGESVSKCTRGYYKVYLTYISDDVMTIDKVEYQKNANYIELKDDEIKEKTITNLDKNNDGKPDTEDYKIVDGVIYKKDKVVYDPNKEYEFSYDMAYIDKVDLKLSKDNLDLEDLNNYLGAIRGELAKYSYMEFNKDNIHTIMAGIATPCYSRIDASSIKKLAKMYFNIDDYELPVGTYNTDSLGKIDFVRVDDKYISVREWEGGCHSRPPYSGYLSHEINDDELVVKFDVRDIESEGNDNSTTKNMYGILTIHLEFKDNSLILKSSEFTPKN